MPLVSYAIDTDGDGSDAVEEALAGTSDSNSDERPYWSTTLIGYDDRFGAAVSDAGDVNGDGYADIIIGAPYSSSNGRAFVYSGADNSVLHTLDGSTSLSTFGRSVSGAGDVNNDGYADLIVGAPNERKDGFIDAGAARVFSGVDGSLLYVFYGDVDGDEFGFSVSGAGDVNNDGYDDMVVGAFKSEFLIPNNMSVGSARVFSGLDGSVLHYVIGEPSARELGWDVSGAGDVNADGYADFMASTTRYLNNVGLVHIYSGANGSVLYTHYGDATNNRFGVAVSDAGDVNADGYDDVIIGGSGDINGGMSNGLARVFSGFDGSVLYQYNADDGWDYFGQSVSGAGDVNGDGYADFMVGATEDDNNGEDSGSVRVYSGIDGSVLYTFNGDAAGDLFGIDLSGAGDMDGDGYDDFIVSSWYYADVTYVSYVRVFLSSDLFNDSDLDYLIDSDRDGQENVVDLDDDNDGSIDEEEILAGTSVIDPGERPYWWRTFSGDNAGDRFGTSVSGAGDVNNDGYDDLIIGAPLDDDNESGSGSARVISGFDGSELYNFYGDSLDDNFGVSVSGVGDLNNDGYADVITGSNLNNSNSDNDNGSAYILSGMDGGVLQTFNGPFNDTHLGYSVSDAGDVNNDGYTDIIVGSNLVTSELGYAWVFSGWDGASLYTFRGDNVNDFFGYSVSGAGDVNNDGYADLIVGAYGDDNQGGNSGSATVFSGMTGSVEEAVIGLVML